LLIITATDLLANIHKNDFVANLTITLKITITVPNHTGISFFDLLKICKKQKPADLQYFIYLFCLFA
jgi:hypothetical protein